jgi:hypothetical protein
MTLDICHDYSIRPSATLWNHPACFRTVCHPLWGKRGLKPALLAEQPEQRRICQMRKQALQTVRFLSPY